MADAFVAIADDATAASWNPAGLVQLERPEISTVAAFNAVRESLSAHYHPEVSGEHDAKNLDLNYLSVAWPLPFLLLDRNVCVALSYQHKYDFSRDFSLDYNSPVDLGFRRLGSNLLRLEFEQVGGLGALSPAFAVELTGRLSLGMTLNLWRSTPFNDNSWTQKTRVSGITLLNRNVQINQADTHESYEGFRGENAVFGLLWSPVDAWRLGLRYDTAFTGDVRYQRVTTLLRAFPTAAPPARLLDAMSDGAREHRHVRFPDSLALGVAWRASDRWTFSADITRTDWRDFQVETGNGRKLSLVDGSAINDALTRPNLAPTHTVRVGAEYVMLPRIPRVRLPRVWTLRGGLFYDEEPATGRAEGFRWPGDKGSGRPDRFYGCSLGVGLLANQRVNLDAAYQLRWGPHVNADLVRGVRGFEENVVQHRILLSTILYF